MAAPFNGDVNWPLRLAPRGFLDQAGFEAKGLVVDELLDAAR
jgi:hypothetical protein